MASKNVKYGGSPGCSTVCNPQTCLNPQAMNENMFSGLPPKVRVLLLLHFLKIEPEKLNSSR